MCLFEVRTNLAQYDAVIKHLFQNILLIYLVSYQIQLYPVITNRPYNKFILVTYLYFD